MSVFFWSAFFLHFPTFGRHTERYRVTVNIFREYSKFWKGFFIKIWMYQQYVAISWRESCRQVTDRVEFIVKSNWFTLLFDLGNLIWFRSTFIYNKATSYRLPWYQVLPDKIRRWYIVKKICRRKHWILILSRIIFFNIPRFF